LYPLLLSFLSGVNGIGKHKKL
jgi:hypothetical protein